MKRGSGSSRIRQVRFGESAWILILTLLVAEPSGFLQQSVASPSHSSTIRVLRRALAQHSQPLRHLYQSRRINYAAVGDDVVFQATVPPQARRSIAALSLHNAASRTGLFRTHPRTDRRLSLGH